MNLTLNNRKINEGKPFYGDHSINATRITGALSCDKEQMIMAIVSSIETADVTFLDVSAMRSTLQKFSGKNIFKF